MNKTQQMEQKLKTRKLKAEAELAEMKLAEAKQTAQKPYWARCLACGGRRGHTELCGGGWSGRMRVRLFYPCKACGGRGRQLVYPQS